jgi:hypothetical protein
LGSQEWENCGSRLAQANSLKDPISKITRGKWTGGVVQAAVRLLCKHEVLSSNPSPTLKKKEKMHTPRILYSSVQEHKENSSVSTIQFRK